MTAAKLQAGTEELVDVAKETVASDTNVKVANIHGRRQEEGGRDRGAARPRRREDRPRDRQLDAQRTQILGKAEADVERLKNEAEAKGAKMLVDAFGSPQAYNHYIFAKNFEPKDLRLIFAGPGTFWTDLKTFEQVGGAQNVLAEQQQPPKK